MPLSDRSYMRDAHQNYLTLKCEYCPATISLPIKAESGPIPEYGQLYALYLNHLSWRHSRQDADWDEFLDKMRGGKQNI